MPAFPFWLEIGDREWRGFLSDCCAAAGPMGVLHYNTFRAKRILMGSDYRWCADNLPGEFIGTKTALADFGMWCEFRFQTPELVHVPMETCMVPSLMTGGKAFISATLGPMNPALAVDWYASCMRGEWESAMAFQLRVNRVEHVVCNRLFRRQGYRAGALSKALASVGNYLSTHRRMRKPYQAVPDDLIAEARRLVAELMPELLSP
jgi:dihydrodipicolinate synthase/N-acetylneuraminate lyase